MGHFPQQEALIKLYYLALRNLDKKWAMQIQDRKAVLNRFIIVSANRSINRFRDYIKSRTSSLRLDVPPRFCRTDTMQS